MLLRFARKTARNLARSPASGPAGTLALTLSLCAGATTATAPAAVAAQPISFLIDSVSGPVTYPVCAPPLTWSAALPAEWSAAEQEREVAQWRQAFAELTALTDYTFAELPPGEPQPRPPSPLTIHSTRSRPLPRWDRGVSRVSPGTVRGGWHRDRRSRCRPRPCSVGSAPWVRRTSTRG